MAKLDALKAKVAAAKAGLVEKLEKVPFLRKLREKKAASAPTPSGSPTPSLGGIYREGSTSTRLQVIMVYALALASIYATVHFGRKVLKRIGAGKQNEQLKADYSHGLAEMNAKVVENANLISMGNFTSRLQPKNGVSRMMATDIWVRVSEPSAADFAQKNEMVLNDRIIEALNSIEQEDIDPVSESGKAALKNRVAKAISEALPKGKVEEVFFQNLIVQ